HDIMETLKRPHMIKHIYPIDKENITFTIQKVDDNQQKKAIILDIYQKFEYLQLFTFQVVELPKKFRSILQPVCQISELLFIMVEWIRLTASLYSNSL